ncbi:MAG: hypothetical protein ABI618_09885 [Nitrospirota bacterium]
MADHLWLEHVPYPKYERGRARLQEGCEVHRSVIQFEPEGWPKRCRTRQYPVGCERRPQ